MIRYTDLVTTENRPRIVVSQCLGFAACRYNGEVASGKLSRLIGPFVEWVPVCPEVEIGLGTPREPVRLVSPGRDSSRLRLVQPATGQDVSQAMVDFSRTYLSALKEVDGFLLKGASPSCGPFDARYYGEAEKSPSFGRGAGLFAAAVLERFPHLAVEDEGRLTNLRIREHFLTRVFTACRFRHIKRHPSLRSLIDFHARNKLLLMAYNQTRMREMGRLVAGLQRRDLPAGLENYERLLGEALHRLPRLRSHTNVLQHAFGYFSKDLSPAERAHFLQMIERYHQEKTSLLSLVEVMKSWLVRFKVEYLQNQTYFDPFPEELFSLHDSGKGRI